MKKAFFFFQLILFSLSLSGQGISLKMELVDLNGYWSLEGSLCNHPFLTDTVLIKQIVKADGVYLQAIKKQGDSCIPLEDVYFEGKEESLYDLMFKKDCYLETPDKKVLDKFRPLLKFQKNIHTNYYQGTCRSGSNEQIIGKAKVEIVAVSWNNDIIDIRKVYGFDVNVSFTLYRLKNYQFLDLTKATTLDAKSVSVDYTVKNPNLKQIHFDVYRSANPFLRSDNNSTQYQKKIGETDIKNNADLAISSHTINIKLNSDESLHPDTRMPYVVAVSTCNGFKESVYFRKWMLGAITHGYYWLADAFGTFGLNTDPWETDMAYKLTYKDGYDYVIAFNWKKTCSIPKHGFAEAAGEKLANEMAKWIFAKQNHPGDVVDIHVIGHSRGAVVVSQALLNLANRNLSNTPPEKSPPIFGGGYVEITLLDPHPANSTLGEWASFSPSEGIRKVPMNVTTANFNANAKDSPVILVKGISKIDVWFQQSSQKNFPGSIESVMDLWGLISGQAIVVGDSGLEIDIKEHNLTNISIPGIGFIGHGEVPYVYEIQAVDGGTLNRSKASN